MIVIWGPATLWVRAPDLSGMHREYRRRTLARRRRGR